jgi:hypothetical protein
VIIEKEKKNVFVILYLIWEDAKSFALRTR